MLFKKFVFIFIFLPLISFSQSINQSHENYKAFYYSSGKISSEGYLLNGKPNGYWITYYENELRKSEGNRKNHLLDSAWKFYRENGNLKTIITYKNDLKHGFSFYYNNDCRLTKKEEYEKGKLVGTQNIYFALQDSVENIKEQIPYSDGRKEGLGFEFAKDGRVITRIVYVKGFISSREKINRKDNQGKKQGAWKEYYKNERLKKEERYKDDLLSGYVKLYSIDGKLESAQLYIDGVLQSGEENQADFDIQTLYYDDGSIKQQTTYNLAGKKDGISKTFSKEGKVESTEVYRNGYLLAKGIIDIKGLYQGLWEEYYLNGKLKSKGEYLNGKKYKKWLYYFQSGKVEQEGFYDKNGQYTNLWQWYYEDGSLLRKEEFRKGIEDGMLEEYNRKGDLISKGEYIDGEREGEWYYELNDHKEEGKYRYGERNGNWKHYYPNGKLSFEGAYVDGVPEGKHKYYYENGVTEKIEIYSYGLKDGKWQSFDKDGTETMNIQYKDDKPKRINGTRVNFSDI